MGDPAALLGPSGRGVLATLRRDGRPQLSVVDFAHAVGERVIRISTTDGRAKVANLRRDPRASLFVGAEGMSSYAVVEGSAELSAVAADRADDVVAELVDLYRAVQGEHPDWDDYRRAMVEDRRLVRRLRVERVYGFAPTS